MIVIGIDPGPKESAYVVWSGNEIEEKGIVKNEFMLNLIRQSKLGPAGSTYVIEGMQSFGKPVGKDVFETCYFIGKIMEASGESSGRPIELVYRPAIKVFLCGTVRANDKGVRDALIERLGKEKTKGCTGHMWSALAVAYTFYSTMVERENIRKREIQ